VTARQEIANEIDIWLGVTQKPALCFMKQRQFFIAKIEKQKILNIILNKNSNG